MYRTGNYYLTFAKLHDIVHETTTGDFFTVTFVVDFAFKPPKLALYMIKKTLFELPSCSLSPRWIDEVRKLSNVTLSSHALCFSAILHPLILFGDGFRQDQWPDGGAWPDGSRSQMGTGVEGQMGVEARSGLKVGPDGRGGQMGIEVDQMGAGAK